MKILLDVNILLACGWQTHKFHKECSAWLNSLESYTLCPITKLGFLRISMSPALGASFADAMTLVKWFAKSPRAHQLACDQNIASMPQVSSYKDTTDAYLVYLAACHGHRLATLDTGIVKKNWSAGIAFNPLSNNTNLDQK